MGKIKVQEKNFFNEEIKGKGFKFIDRSKENKKGRWLKYDGHTYLGELRKSGKIKYYRFRCRGFWNHSCKTCFYVTFDTKKYHHDDVPHSCEND